MLQYYIIDDTRRDKLDISHFPHLRDAVRAYKDLPGDNYKRLGVHEGIEAADLILRLPLRPGEPPVEDVLDLGFLEQGGWKSRPGFMTTVHELAIYLMVRCCLYRGCLIPAPVKNVLPRKLREKYLWPDVPGDFNTSIHWIEVAGVGRLSTAEFKRRFRQGVVASSVSPAPPQAGEPAHSAAPPLPTKPEERLCGDPFDIALFCPLVLRLGACGMTRHGRYAALEVTPWQFHLLARCSQERLDQNKTLNGGKTT